jgi:hypothetical protein
MKYSIATLGTLAFPAVASAQAQAEPVAPPWIALAGLCPLIGLIIVLLVLLFLVLRRSGVMRGGGYMEMARNHIERANAHMAGQAEREARIIELLESIERELQRSDGINREGIKKV